MTTTPTMDDLGRAIGAQPKTKGERRTVRVNLDTFAVYPLDGYRNERNRIGSVVQYVRNDGARTPSGGRYTSRRITVRLTGDSRRWVGTFKSGEKEIVRLRPLTVKNEDGESNA